MAWDVRFGSAWVYIDVNGDGSTDATMLIQGATDVTGTDFGFPPLPI